MIDNNGMPAPSSHFFSLPDYYLLFILLTACIVVSLLYVITVGLTQLCHHHNNLIPAQMVVAFTDFLTTLLICAILSFTFITNQAIEFTSIEISNDIDDEVLDFICYIDVDRMPFFHTSRLLILLPVAVVRHLHQIVFCSEQLVLKQPQLVLKLISPLVIFGMITALFVKLDIQIVLPEICMHAFRMAFVPNMIIIIGITFSTTVAHLVELGGMLNWANIKLLLRRVRRLPRQWLNKTAIRRYLRQQPDTTVMVKVGQPIARCCATKPRIAFTNLWFMMPLSVAMVLIMAKQDPLTNLNYLLLLVRIILMMSFDVLLFFYYIAIGLH